MMPDATAPTFRAVLDNEQLEPLLARVSLKDREAFRRLYQLAAPHLLGVAMRILQTRGTAEEALQDAFVQIWQRAGTYRPEKARASTWMTSIVRYRALDTLRRSGRETSIDDVPEMALPSSPSAETTAEPALRRCLGELPKPQQDALALAFVQGYTHQQLSRKLNTPLGTVKSWIRRSLQQLKDCLGQ